ncbi:ribonuclease II [Prochlorococcus marinus XMU1403]|uniref:ribonuclease catalytic domain-containing protein n=1 Tax=Prochlorococcus marinus TaxID=1219 RepID=UPI000D9DE648|nr:ribonuclease catalytic domain-containing protein [Prochlorococcus marinus]MBW3049372.1 ribonuclease II [Prochlorococcus marinus str. MU1403]PYE02326.1 ribonuclease II [Prochlorococcus marinus XMU1403]
MGTKIIEDEIKDLIFRSNTTNNLNSAVKDLTHLKTYTIDDSKTVEIDDAISLEQVSGQNKLWIHIASPASYIEYQSGIDEKARKLISTVYLSNNTYYMLPKALINNVFSLSDKEKRESLSLGVILNDDGSISSTEIVQSLIQVDYRLDFKEADELIDYAPKEEIDLSLISTILESRKSWRKNLGSIEILESYGKIVVEDKIPNIKIIDPTVSRQLISEAMILYGDIISNFTKLNKIPVPYRVQERSDKVSKDNIQLSDNKILYNFLLKKTMGKTYYSINPMQHDSLALTSYLHATSPIRRYADLLVHYQLNRFLNNKVLISMDDVQQIIHEINNQGRQNIMRFREDQKYWLGKWFENNTFNEYSVILLNWINRYKNICLLYFVDYNFSTISNLHSKLNINIGDNFNVKNTNHDNNDMNYFEIIQ